MTIHRISFLTFGLCLALGTAACNGDDSSSGSTSSTSGTSGSTGGSTSGSTGNTTATTQNTTGMTTGTTTGTTTGGMTTGTDTGTAGSDTGTASGGSGGSAGSTGGGVACLDCVTMNCANELGACQADAACACWASCLNDGNDEATCQQDCGEPPTTLIDLETCILTECGNVCN